MEAKRQEVIQAFDKPCGFNSHRANQSVEGWLEYISRISKKKFWLCHRLDKDTSGVIVLANSKESSQKAYDLFAQRKVVKKYLFVTDRKISNDNFSIKTKIKKQGKQFLSFKEDPNSETHFKLRKTWKRYHLWQALPVTGKTHQIRIHAKEAGMPILGDILYGGTDCFRVMLHCHEMDLPWDDSTQHFFAPVPKYFQTLELLDDLNLCQAISSIDIRIKLYSENTDFSKLPDSIRLIHSEHPWLRCDKLGKVLWFASFHPQKQLEDILPLIMKLKTHFRFEGFSLRIMVNRGKDPHRILNATSDNLPEEWMVQEKQWKFKVKTTMGVSSGIFLDQRQNRNWVYKNSKNKKVLNLYSYTSVFSVVAALGGAEEVISVDSSKTTLSWAKENFELNKLNPEKYEFWTSDCEAFLKGCIRRGRKFDLIICDPPSFSRSKKKVFKIETAFEELLRLCHSCLSSNGILLFSSNFEKWKREDFEKRISKDFFTVKEAPIADYDFELPGQKRILKSFFLMRKDENDTKKKR